MTGFFLGLALGLYMLVLYDASLKRWHKRACDWVDVENAKQAAFKAHADSCLALMEELRGDLRSVGWDGRETQVAKLIDEGKRIA